MSGVLLWVSSCFGCSFFGEVVIDVFVSDDWIFIVVSLSWFGGGICVCSFLLY